MAIGGLGDFQQETQARNRSEDLNPQGGAQEGCLGAEGGGAGKPEVEVQQANSPLTENLLRKAAPPYYVRTEEHDTETETEEESTETEGTPSPEQASRGPAGIAMEEGLTETTERVAASQKERIFYSMLAAVEAAETVRTTGNVAFTAGSYQNALTLYSVALRHLEEARKLQTGERSSPPHKVWVTSRSCGSLVSAAISDPNAASLPLWERCAPVPLESLPLQTVLPFQCSSPSSPFAPQVPSG